MDPEPASLFSAFDFDWQVSLGLVALLILLILSAVISGTEVAFFSLSKADLEKDDSSNINQIKELLENPKKLLATILISNNFINILFILLFTYVGDYYFQELTSPLLKFLIEIVVVTFLILLFGEVLPKIYATRNSFSFASFMAKPMIALRSMLTFVSSPLLNLTNLVENKLRKKNSDISVEVLSQALELTSKGATTKEEKKILQGIVNFGNTETSQIMCPRMDIFALSSDEEFNVITEKIIKKGHSRIPVYDENIDSIIGILYTKDLIPHINKKTFQWKKIIREAFFVPENKKLDDLLKEFQEMKNHMAIVVDEYGGTSGLITLEDIIEEIVGDISDEFDQNDLSYSKLDDFNYVFEAKTTLKDFYKVLQIDETHFEDQKFEAETIAGLILEITGKFPKKNDHITFKRYEFTIEAVDKKRIKQVKVTLPMIKNPIK
ncbi:gliding motility-associated protein GldE [Lutimonas zeaxanthinifaciens]|uniref:gliding motility-associated protein GldE n=1 Tax=Lutimonas zeaxanthinifaciens TaxID=3060215 RepID=UPI00265CDE99|nr:gliding motility-associated protein GldE [Lutimonas sp. YSD2104]WKK66552.1 gliding motility-associated protein GldE [Lutimonas sp. YSD2104]